MTHRPRGEGNDPAPARPAAPGSPGDAQASTVTGGSRLRERLQAPRGTADVLPEDFARREALEAKAREILESAGFRRIETPTFEHTELFARGVGEATDIVQKEMYTSEDAGGRSQTL